MHVLVEQSLTIRSRKSKKDRQYYGQKKKNNRTLHRKLNKHKPLENRG